MSLFRRIWYCLQKFQREHPEPFLISFQFYILSLLWFNSLFLLADSSVHIDSYELCLLGKGNQAFGDKRFYLDRSGIDCKMFQRGHPEPILTIFRFFTRSTIGQTLTFMDHPSVRINSYEPGLL